MVHALIKEENVMDFPIVETDLMKQTVVCICLLWIAILVRLMYYEDIIINTVDSC